MTSKKLPKINIVEWEDSVTVANESLEGINTRPPELVETYGVIVRKDDKYCIVMTHDSKAGCNDYLRIPIGMVHKIRRA